MEQILKKITEICKQNADITKVVLFGSRARGTHNHSSDFDIALFHHPLGENKLALLHQLDDLDCLHKIDVLLVTEETNPILLENIQKEGIILMERRTKLENFTKAVARLAEAVELCTENPCSFYFDGLIQRFEFTTELAWKTCKEQLQEQGFVEVNGPKPVMREAFSAGLIQEPEIWMSILTDRNRTSHIYDESTAKEISERVMDCYLPEFQKLLGKLS